MSTATASIDRSLLSLPNLIIEPGGLYQFTPDGLGSPAITWRFDNAPDVPGVHGSARYAGAKEMTSLPWELIIVASSRAEVTTAYEALGAALDQWAYDIALTVDGATRTWSAWPANYARGPIRADEQDAFLCTVAVTIPIYPIPA